MHDPLGDKTGIEAGLSCNGAKLSRLPCFHEQIFAN